MSFAFKKFNFLQHAEVSNHGFPKNVTCCATSAGHLFVGCDNGNLAVLDATFQLAASFQAHAFRVFHVEYLEERQLLMTVGSEEPGYSTTHLKLWDVPRLLTSASPPSGTAPPAASTSAGGATAAATTQQPVKLLKVFSPKHPEAEITALSALALVPPPPGDDAAGAAAAMTSLMMSPNMLAGVPPSAAAAAVAAGGVLAIALGLATGMVYVYHVELPPWAPDGHHHAPPKPGAAARAGPPQPSKPLSVTKLSARPEAGHAWAVTGLELHGADIDRLSLFVVTESQTLSFNLHTHIKSVLDAQGAPSSGCTVLRQPSGQGQGPHHRPTPTNPYLLAEEEAGPSSLSQPPILLVARDEGLYNYAPDTRAGCTVLEGTKQRLALLGRFVVVVTTEKTEVGTSSATVLIMDLPHKLISGSLTVHSVAAIIAWHADGPGRGAGAGGGGGGAAGDGRRGGTGKALGGGRAALAGPPQKPLLVVVTGGNRLYTFKEVPLAMQLESLFKRSLHKLALDLARVQAADDATIAGIQQRWADFQYAKGEFDAAMALYCETIGHLEPSYVIRRFLDAQRIHNLTAYLELLHDKGMAGADHTTLLLNCYTKLKDVDKLDAFIKRSVVLPSGGAPTAAGDGAPSTPAAHPAGTATAAAGTGSPYKAAQNGADAAGGRAGSSKRGSKRSGKRHASIGSLLGLHAATEAEKPAGDEPQGSKPGELKFDAETAVKVLRSAGYARHALTVAQAAGNTDWQLDILLEDCGAWDEALEVMSRLPRAQCAAALRRVGKVLVTQRPEPTTGLIMDLCAPSKGASGQDGYAGSVADFSHLFCDAPTGLMLLCEFILASAPPGTIADERMLHHTLLELYLADSLEPSRSRGGALLRGPTASGGAGAAAVALGSASSQPAPAGPRHDLTPDAKERRTKALALLHSGWPDHLEQPKYDQEHALVLCRLAGFAEGLVLLYDRLRLYREVMQVHMDAKDVDALVACALQYGDVARGGDPQLWALLLEFLAQQPAAAVEHVVVQVVEQIEARGLLPPVMVLQLLAANTGLQVSCLRDYVGRHLSREAAEAARDREAASRLASDSAALRSELGRLASQARVFQASRCSATGMPLELPVIHFLCGHAFNARALGDNDRECPLCSPEYRRVVEIRRNMAASALQQDRFFTELRESSDGFSVVADHFGRGLMNMTAGALNAEYGSPHGAGLMGLAAVLAPGGS